MTIKVRFTGTVGCSFTKTLEFADQAELDEFCQNEEANLLCNIDDDDLQDIHSIASYEKTQL